MSTPRLSSLSFQTLSLLLERQRLRTLGKAPPATQLVTIKRNMEILREGILDLEKLSATDASLSNDGTKRNGNGVSEARKAAEELRSQWQRARRILGEEETDLEDLPPPSQTPEEGKEPFSDPTQPPVLSSDPFEAPFRDEPSRPPSPPALDPSDEVQVQRQMMDEQDTHLETLSHSIRRQRELSENIGNELDVHTGLLEDLESGLDNTAIRLGGARRKLDKVAKGTRENCSTVTIGALIIILLILIIIFKT